MTEWIRKEQDKVVAVLQFLICGVALALAVSRELRAVEKLRLKARKKAGVRQKKR